MASLSETTKVLVRMKERIREISEQRIRAESLRDQALKRISEFGYDNIDDAVEALDKQLKEVTKQEAKLEDMIAKLQEDYPEL